jgi:hypothetical protein
MWKLTVILPLAPYAQKSNKKQISILSFSINHSYFGIVIKLDTAILTVDVSYRISHQITVRLQEYILHII